MGRPRDLRIRVDDDTELRLQRVEEAQEYLDLINGDRERLRTFMHWVDEVTNIEDEEAFLVERVREYDLGIGISMAVWHKDQLIGAVGTVTMSREMDSVEVGYFVQRAHEGKGLMTPAVGAFVDHLFKEEGMNRVSARIIIDNVRSHALIDRLGFIQEGVHRQEYKLYGAYKDLVVYSLLRSEWEARR